MISSTQYSDASEFLSTYKDALKCVEQIAEKRQTFAHYEQSARAVTEGINADQIKLEQGKPVGGSNASEFVYKKAHDNGKEVFAKYKFAHASTRDEFVKSLNVAVEGLSE